MDAYKSLLELRFDALSRLFFLLSPSLLHRNKAAAAAKAEAAKGFVTDPGAAKLAVQDPSKEKGGMSPGVSRSNSESRSGLTESSFRDRLGGESSAAISPGPSFFLTPRRTARD